MSNTQRFYYPDARVKWDASSALPEMDLTIPATMGGKLVVYQVPVCDAYPEGYFVNLAEKENDRYPNVEPGCATWEKKLLLEATFSKRDASVVRSTANDSNSTTSNTLDYLDPSITIDEKALYAERVELIDIADSTVTGTSGSSVDANLVFTGPEDTICSVTISPVNCILSGYTSRPEETFDGKDRTISGNLSDINAEIAKLKITIGKTNGSVLLSWNADTSVTTATVAVKVG